MKKSFYQAHQQFIATSVVVLNMLLAGTVFYHLVEKWSWLDSLYFSVISLTTVGYGDFSPQTNPGKVFTMFYVLVGIGVFVSFIDVVSKQRVTKREKKIEERTTSSDKK